MQEVIVTAQKREERLIDTPQSVSMLSADDLEKLVAMQFRDFANTVPGLNFTTTGAGYTQISLRGVTAGFDIGSTVGVYIDDVPYGSSSGFAQGGQVALDVGLFDIERIEILRGPQGTLYGASTMGGLIKYVTRQPDVTELAAEAQVGISSTQDGGTSPIGSAVVNVPVAADRAALRASAFYSRDGGYIDNIAVDRDDVNRADIYGGRLDVLFVPAEAMTLRIGGFLQNISRDGEATADHTLAGEPVHASLAQRRLFSEPFDQQFRLVSGTVTYDFGPAELTSISAYQTLDTEVVYDISGAYVPLLESFFGLSFSAIGLPQEVSTDKFTQELRLASAADAPVEWLVGAFYTHESSRNLQTFALRDPAGQPAPNTVFSLESPSTYDEYAGFANLTFRLTEKLDASGGIRYARNEQDFEQIGAGLLGVTTPRRDSSEDVFTYLVNSRYHFTEDSTAYVRFATGYRPGGPNFVLNDPGTGLPVGPPTFDADRLKSYEVGYKMQSADGSYGLDAAVYYIDWKDIHIAAVRGGFSVIENAGKATVRGAELALSARPVPQLALTGSFAYQNAELAEDALDLGGRDGERLPNVPRFTGSLTADYAFPVDTWQPALGATIRYVSERRASFDESVSFPQYRLPEYTTVDLRGDIVIGEVGLQLYVRNLFDERGELSAFGAYSAAGQTKVSILQPRTVGIIARMRF